MGKRHECVTFNASSIQLFHLREILLTKLCTRSVVIVTTVSNVNPPEKRLFTNFNPKTKNELIWRVARMTSAAPSFFPHFTGPGEEKFWDGGIVANNPTRSALTEFDSFNYKLREHVKFNTQILLSNCSDLFFSINFCNILR